MKKRNATALSEILYQDINKIGDFTEDFQKLLFQNVLGLTSGVITGLNVTLDAPSGVSVAVGSMVDSSFAYGELEGVSGVSLETLPEDDSTRYDIVTAKYLELADSPGASYVLIDVESRTQSTQNVYRRKFGAIVIEIIEDTTSGALTGGRIPLAQLEVTSGGIQDIVDLRQFTKPSNFDLDSMLDGLTNSINELIGAYNPGGDVSGDIDNLTVEKIKNIPVSGAPTASGQILRINADQTAFEYVDGSDLGGGGGGASNQILQWTESGITITSGIYTYDIPAAASGSLTILPGDGMVFYDASEWEINEDRNQITFTPDGLPDVGSKLEFFYSSNTDIEDISIWTLLEGRMDIAESDITDLKDRVSNLEGSSAPEGIPVGAIIIWKGDACPAGYVRDDDFASVFLMGAPIAENPGSTGGAATHTHTLGSHTHSFSGTTGNATVPGFNIYGQRFSTGGEDKEHHHSFSGTTGAASGDTGSSSSLPPYRTVLFCRKE